MPCLIATLGIGNNPASAQPAAPTQAPAIGLDAALPSIEISQPIRAWVDPRGDAGIDKVARAAPGMFTMTPSTAFHDIDSTRALWVHLRLENASHTGGDWIVTIPLPQVDRVSAYQRSSSGAWLQHSAGDRVAVTDWPVIGLYPKFSVRIDARSTRDLYLQVRNFKGLVLPIRIDNAQSHAQWRDLEYSVLGLVIGALLMLSAWCAGQYAQRRNRVEGWFTVYGLLIAVVIATLSGLLAQFLWPQSPIWSDSAHEVLTLLGVGATLLLVRYVCALSTSHPLFDKLLLAGAWLAVTVTPLYWALERTLTSLVQSCVIGFVPSLGLVGIAIAWRRNNPAAPWLALSFAPQALVLMLGSLQSLRVLPGTEPGHYVLIGVMALTVPVLLHAVNLRLRERREVKTRADHLPSQDALTGLLTDELFGKQLQDVVVRASEHKEPAAVVLVEVVNYERIKQVYGDATAEQCLLRAVVKLHRVLRDVDPAGRIGNARFGLIIEGITSRQALSERMVKLIASGLIPLPGLTPEVTLHFHVAAVLLSEKIPDATSVISELATLLGTMSSRTRRPIRFLEPEPTRPTPLSPTSTFGQDRTGAFPIV
ncbi:MAG: diguanylate cyclase [Rhodoferax sp.]|nr:diguanylate cyclase [Rhodoferax sp.]